MSVTDDIPTPASDAAPTAGKVALLRSVKWWLAILTVLLMSVWLSFGAHLLYSKMPDPAHDTAMSAAEKQPPVSLDPKQVVEGPWGRLEIAAITISPPPESLVQRLGDASTKVQWHFPRTTSRQLGEAFIKLGLPNSLIDRLKSMAKFNNSIGGYTIYPPRELVLGLSPDIRAKLYAFLHEFLENKDQRRAFQFCGQSVDQWFGDSPLLPETKRLVTPLIYRHGSFMFFSDLRSIETLMPSSDERLTLIETLARESTLLLTLDISSDSDIDALVNYWGRGGRASMVRPVIESFSRLPGEHSLDVTHLLPPFARQRIYSYPTVLGKSDPSVVRDCHWTAFNFFSEKPDDRFGNAEAAFDTLGKDYHRIFDDPRFGDLVVYVDDEDWSIHSAVYIAGDVVFTKSGRSVVHPWMFLKLQDMDDYYPQRKRLSRGFFRRNGT